MTEWFIGSLVSGQITNYLPVKSGSWSTELNGPGTINVSVPLYDPSVAALGIRSAATVGQMFLGVAENGVVLNAGPIWKHSYSGDDKTVELAATGLWSLFRRRAILPVVPAGMNYPDGYDTPLIGFDSGTVAKKIVQQSLAGNGGGLPILFQDDLAGASNTTYYGQDLYLVAAALEDLVSGGIDIDFAPQFTSDGQGIQWVLRTGTDVNPQLSSTNQPVWDMSVTQGSVKALQVEVDGSALTSRVWETNAGLSSRYDTSALTAQGYPFYETVDSSHSDEDLQSRLDAYAKEAARLGSKPTELWSFQVKADQQPLVGSYRCGDSCVVKVGSDPYVAKGPYTRRITNLSGDQDGKWVSVTTGQTYSLTG